MVLFDHICLITFDHMIMIWSLELLIHLFFGRWLDLGSYMYLMINLMVIHLVICVKCSINSTSVEQQKERTLPKLWRGRERVNLKEDSHQKRGGEVGQERQEGRKKEEKVNLWCYSVPERPLHRTVYKYTSTQYSSLFFKHKSLNIDGGTLWNWETDQRPRRGFLGRLRESQNWNHTWSIFDTSFYQTVWQDNRQGPHFNIRVVIWIFAEG